MEVRENARGREDNGGEEERGRGETVITRSVEFPLNYRIDPTIPQAEPIHTITQIMSWVPFDFNCISFHFT
jgi:hypothetical protein